MAIRHRLYAKENRRWELLSSDEPLDIPFLLILLLLLVVGLVMLYSASSAQSMYAWRTSLFPIFSRSGLREITTSGA